MHKFATLNCFTDLNETSVVVNNVTQNLRHAVLFPLAYQPNILRALQRANFQYHRSCSLSNLIRDCSVGEGETFLMFWGCERSDSRITTSMSTSSCSTIHVSPTVTNVNAQEKEVRCISQQTDISCRYSPSICSPANLNELSEQHVMLTFSSPTSPPLVQSACRSNSILGSVCALLLSKQGSTVAPKPVSSVTGSFASDNICRICFGGDSGERLVRPCSCRGTIAAVHRSCLERWLLQASTSYCELCRHHYVVTRSHKWTWIQSAWEWARSGRGRALAADAWRAAALGALSVVGTARALHAADRALQVGARRGGAAALAANFLSSLLIGIIGALNGLLTTWMLLKIQEHQMSWQTWRDSTLHVHVTLSGEELTSAQPSDTTVVADEASPTLAADGSSHTVDRSTNVADPFMVALPNPLPEP